MAKPFTVGKVGWCHWEVRAWYQYGSYFVASFWFERSAQQLANRLNQIWIELPKRIEEAEEYKQMMNALQAIV